MGSRHRGRLIVGVVVCSATVLAAGMAAFAAGGFKGRSATITISEFESGTVAAKCKKGTKAVSGGFQGDVSLSSSPELAVVYASHRGAGRKWKSAASASAGDPTLVSRAYCADEKLKAKSKTTTIPGDDGGEPFPSGEVRAKCPKGTKAVSGGFDNPDFVFGSDGTDDDDVAILPRESMKAGKRTWKVSAENYGDGAGTLRAKVNCLDRSIRLKTGDESETFTSPASTSAVYDVDAACPSSNQRVVSGGFDVREAGQSSPIVTASQREGRNAWTVEVLFFLDTTAQVTAFAYCE
jgi:hypothetical protein